MRRREIALMWAALIAFSAQQVLSHTLGATDLDPACRAHLEARDDDYFLCNVRGNLAKIPGALPCCRSHPISRPERQHSKHDNPSCIPDRRRNIHERDLLQLQSTPLSSSTLSILAMLNRCGRGQELHKTFYSVYIALTCASCTTVIPKLSSYCASAGLAYYSDEGRARSRIRSPTHYSRPS